ncbi:MAG: NrfD/PsrC family molybdoenzyme membrane anchor subunit [Thermodesulfobacteriota bacterium]|jgi:tetrathionate reductase subunit C
MSLLYTVPHGEAFGLSIAIYFYLTGLSAGSFIISTLAYGFGFEKFKPLGKVGVVIATVLLIAAPMFLLLHSGRPLRAWHLFVYISGTSPISWGSFLLTLYPLNCIVYGYFMFRGNAKLTKLFGRIGIPLALMVHGYTGFILSFAKAHALWRTSMMPILFLTSAMVSGVAMMILVTIIKDRFFSEKGEINTEIIYGLGKMLLWLLVFDLFLSLSDLGIHYFGERESMETARLFVTGAFAPLFLGVETLMGKVIPLSLVATPRTRNVAVFGFAAVLVMIGIFVMRYNVVLGGEYIPLL